MSKILFTLTGTRYYHGSDFIKPGMEINLIKEPENEFDSEAIAVKIDGLGTIGHVANSVYTVIGETMSAGRMYDKIKKHATAKVMIVTNHGIVCKVSKKSIKE